MKTKAKITILINQDHTHIEIEDSTSHATICELRLTPEQLSMALSRLSCTPCEATLYPANSFKYGKKMKVEDFVLEISKEVFDGYSTRVGKVTEMALKLCPPGCEVDTGFQSKNSFFTKDGKYFARTVKRSWD